MLSISCTSCGKGYRVGDEAAGKKVRCKQCGAAIRVPGLPTGAQPSPSQLQAKQASPPLSLTTPTAKPVRPAPVAPPISDGDDDLAALASLESTGAVVDSGPMELSEDAPPPPSSRPAASRGRSINDLRRTSPAVTEKPQRRFALGFHLDWPVRLLLIFGVILTIYGWKEWRLGMSTSDTPQAMTCAELGANGPGDNNHVKMTDYVRVSKFVALRSADGSGWQTIWVPVIPPSQLKSKLLTKLHPGVVKTTSVDASLIHVLVKSHRVKTEPDIAAIIGNTQVDGVVVNKIESLTEKERSLLRDEYPTMDIEHCYILEEGRPINSGAGFLSLAGGVLMILAGVGMMLRPN